MLVVRFIICNKPWLFLKVFCLKEKCVQLENEKNEVLRKCEELQAKIERFKNKKCTSCSLLENELQKERKERRQFKKEEKAKLLMTIAKTLENLDDGNTNQMTHQRFTQLVYGKSDTSPKKNITLIEENDDSEDKEDKSNILVNDTVIINESEESSDEGKEIPIVIPETEATDNRPLKALTNQLKKDCKDTRILINKLSSDEDIEIEPAPKKSRMSPVLSAEKIESPMSYGGPQKSLENTLVNRGYRSPSVLSEIIEAAGVSSSSRSNEDNNCQDEKGIAWKMKPSVVLESSGSAAGGKKLKQMTLSLTKVEKKHDISVSEGFNGGLAKLSDDDNDVVLPSPQRFSKRVFCKKKDSCMTLEDPDLTLFNPAVTSTCQPAETSFDRLPEQQNSPTYKYRRDTVRKREERMKLPGQDCDQCAKYYAAAGLDKSQDMRARLNTCSRHRDKYQIRAKTPPGFWDPVLPVSP